MHFGCIIITVQFIGIFFVRISGVPGDGSELPECLSSGGCSECSPLKEDTVDAGHGTHCPPRTQAFDQEQVHLVSSPFHLMKTAVKEAFVMGDVGLLFTPHSG